MMRVWSQKNVQNLDAQGKRITKYIVKSGLTDAFDKIFSIEGNNIHAIAGMSAAALITIVVKLSV